MRPSRYTSRGTWGTWGTGGRDQKGRLTRHLAPVQCDPQTPKTPSNLAACPVRRFAAHPLPQDRGKRGVLGVQSEASSKPSWLLGPAGGESQPYFPRCRNQHLNRDKRRVDQRSQDLLLQHQAATSNPMPVPQPSPANEQEGALSRPVPSFPVLLCVRVAKHDGLMVGS